MAEDNQPNAVMDVDVEDSEPEEEVEAQNSQNQRKKQGKFKVCERVHVSGKNARLCVGTFTSCAEKRNSTWNTETKNLQRCIERVQRERNIYIPLETVKVPASEHFPECAKRKLNTEINHMIRRLTIDPFRTTTKAIVNKLAPSNQRIKFNSKHVADPHAPTITKNNESFNAKDYHFSLASEIRAFENRPASENRKIITATKGSKSTSLREIKLQYFGAFRSGAVRLNDVSILMFCITGIFSVEYGGAQLVLGPMESMRLVKNSEFIIEIDAEGGELLLLVVNENISKSTPEFIDMMDSKLLLEKNESNAD